jgi:adenylosuccinate lyase
VLEEPTSLRIDDPGVRVLFTEAARFQSWLDVEAALAQAQAELGIIPESAAREIVSKAHLKYLDLAAVRAGLAKTGHPLVPLIWELDRAWERRPRTSRRPASCCRCAAPTTSSCASSRAS